ncbi:MAG: transcription-repair coupling factor, partial [Pirellulaceae bacterium]|nr:transcription-repair coupling factor [Pirellulaceae bacterium]
ATLVLVLPAQADIDDVCEELELFWDGHPLRFPAWESEPDERTLHDDIYADRLRVLKELSSTQPPRVVVTSIESLLQPTPSQQSVADNTKRIEVGSRTDTEQLRRWLVTHAFHPTSAVELPGEFSMRGGILDLFAPDWIRPVRIEFFDDEVESIRSFDVGSQRSITTMQCAELTVLGSSQIDDAHLAAFLPEHSWLAFVELETMAENARGYLSRTASPDRFHSFNQVMSAAEGFSHLLVSALSTNSSPTHCQLQIESVERLSGDVARVREELAALTGGDRLFVVSNTSAESDRLREILVDESNETLTATQFAVGALRNGFRLTEQDVLLVSGNELFHRTQLRRPRKRRLGKALDSFLDLRAGDLVVHLAHGIGRYRGLELLDKDGHVEEHLQIEFHGGTKIFVPTAKIDMVQKYIGGSKTKPSLARIGGKTWQRQKRAAELAVTDLASDMLELQAARSSRTGIAFHADTEWQTEFDAAFPYEETPDQRTAIAAIKRDMQTAKPMDRLLCGDVGFGKTEVAMRAAFKVVENGYQAALLAPTTILVEQHFRTIRERMVEFPVSIAKLSRFCTTQEIRKTVADLAAGRVDIVVGTHRLSSRDVKFFNLGLVIIDEEQRFGVEVKEHLKSLKSTVDVLTMSATPIPRTLHMSLVGVRDISNLETAPEDRIAVETRVSRFDADLIRNAVMRELNRGGQIFFVHNRVNDIELIKQRLEHIVPEASIRIGHGQMPEGELEKVMFDFVAGKFDVLLATTIVESGLDIPNANTIFIDEADRYGLADLHQLRGRVGRYKHRAYCYLLVEPHKSITPNAARRLRAIEEFSEMGAGFSISMRDLEIRGAGNLLGTQQSGHIAVVGYELYCQLLETAVRQLKQLPPKLSVDVDIDLPGEAFLPTDYVPDMRLKIDIYRRMTRAASFPDLSELRLEINDRFGPPPAPVERMFELAELKMEAAVWQIGAIYTEAGFIVFRYADRGRIEQLASANRNKVRVVDSSSAYLPMPEDLTDATKILFLVKSVLQAGL